MTNSYLSYRLENKNMGKRYERVWYMAMQEFLHVNRIQTGRLLQSTGFVTAEVWRRLNVDKVTGKSIKRPEYQKIRRKIKAGDSLIIPEMDRLGRKKKIF